MFTKQFMELKMKLVERDETIEVQTMVWLIYGKPSTGKTSLASSIENSILLDFDRGAHGTEYRGRVLTEFTYTDWIQRQNEVLRIVEPYEWIIVDALSTMMNQIQDFMIQQDPALASGKNNMKLYGAIGTEFKAFARKLLTLKKKIILVTHEDYDADSKSTTYRVVGQMARKEVEPTADYITRLYVKGNQRLLMFSHFDSDAYELKNRGNIEKEVVVPSFEDSPNFATELAKRLVSNLGKTKFENKEKTAYMKLQKATIEACTTADELNDVMEGLKTDKTSLPFQLSETDTSMLFEVMKSTAVKNKVNYNKQEKRFE